ncbi:class I adenylate-forming enzyme family protein [Ornithinimicrobium faecis]|uniref:class I adenylate-forming enzyme family protein n=1 Tax=Ornithinimicrobium faecis TaxID=2934158 RepID=UPI0021182F72|nr:AMP-binding protein [Ornithinimicrobium sp. HY1745]
MPMHPSGAPLSIANGVREFARAQPADIAVIDGARQLSYADLAERARRLANTLLSQDLAPGDRVGTLLGNRMEYPEVACGIAMAGLVMVPLNPRMTPGEARHILEHSSARAVILDQAHAQVVTDIIRDHGLYALSLDAPDGAPSYEEALAAAPATDPAIQFEETSPFCIQYTSGTTGQPKGVLISHRSRSLTFYCSALEWGLAVGRRSVAVAPMYHGAGFAFGYAPVHTGGTVVMLRKWDPEELLRLIQKERAQTVFLIPTHAQMLRSLGREVIESYDLSSLDTLYFNAAALPWELKQWVMQTFPGVGVHELYGSTEGGIVTNLRPADMHRKPGSVGQPWFMTEVRVVGPDGEPVATGEPGVLYSRSPFLMNGYHENPEATAECTTEDGFLTCGDVVRVDEDGYITIVDRVKDMIISGGVNVYPREIEEVLATHPDVVEAAVVGQPSEQWGQQVAAFIVLRPSATGDVTALDAHCREHLAGFKIPRTWEFLPSLPRNAGGKVVKRDLVTKENA